MKIKSVLRRTLKGAVVAIVLYALLLGAFYTAMVRGPETFSFVVRHTPWPVFVVLPMEPMWMSARSGHLNVGDAAPDFSLESPDRKGHFQLSSLRGQRPVVLVFGSYT